MDGQPLLLIGVILLAVIPVAVIFANKINGTKHRGKVQEREIYNQKTNQKQRDELLSRLNAAKQEAEAAAADAIYSKLLDRLASPIQELLGFAASGNDISIFSAKAGKKIQGKINEALRVNGAAINNNSLRVPVKQERFQHRFMDNVTNLSERDIEEAIAYYKNEVKRANVHRVSKAIVNAIDSDLCKLTQTPPSDFSGQDISRIAQRLKDSLIKNGIYPLFENDAKFSGRVDLRGLFVEVNDEAIAIPGLFIYINGELYIFGNHQGTCRVEDL